MKNSILTISMIFASATAFCQDQVVLKTYDQVLPRWCIDANFKYGALSNTIGAQPSLVGYDQVLSNAHIGNVQYAKGAGQTSEGGDISVGYFFGKKRMFGVGMGVSLLSQKATLTADSFHVEFSSTDALGKVFRQIITSDSLAPSNQHPGKITENFSSTNISIPLLFKFKHKFTKSVGVTADLGALVNVYMNSNYTTNAVFNYEAIYKEGGGYDNSIAPLSTDLLITKQAYLATHTDGSGVYSFFNAEAQQGRLVGLDKAVTKNSGNVQQNAFGLGAIVQAGLTYQLTYRVTLVLGGYYIHQMFQKTGANTGDQWQMTNKIGDYSSMLNGIKQTNSSNYGLNIGIRYFIGGFSDVDGDGIADAKDDCPTQPGPEKFNGCPDSDGDGIPDKLDACPNDPGSLCTNGCPDRDGDCVDDKNDVCPDDAGLLEFHGCPDRDGDGIPDNMDACPDAPGTKENLGCPLQDLEKYATKLLEHDTARVVTNTSTSSDSYLPPHIVLSTAIIHFDFGKSKMSKESDAKLDEAIDVLNKNQKVILFIGGYTDNIGSMPTNILLSYARAQSVREYLISKGVSKDRIIISGNGKENPINSNKTPEGRAKNRRIEMKVLLPL